MCIKKSIKHVASRFIKLDLFFICIRKTFKCKTMKHLHTKGSMGNSSLLMSEVASLTQKAEAMKKKINQLHYIKKSKYTWQKKKHNKR